MTHTYRQLQSLLNDYRTSDERLALYIGRLNGTMESLEDTLVTVLAFSDNWCGTFEGSSVTIPLAPMPLPSVPSNPELVPPRQAPFAIALHVHALRLYIQLRANITDRLEREARLRSDPPYRLTPSIAPCYIPERTPTPKIMTKKYVAIEGLTGINLSLLKNAQIQQAQFTTHQHIVYTLRH